MIGMYNLICITWLVPPFRIQPINNFCTPLASLLFLEFLVQNNVDEKAQQDLEDVGQEGGGEPLQELGAPIKEEMLGSRCRSWGRSGEPLQEQGKPMMEENHEESSEILEKIPGNSSYWELFQAASFNDAPNISGWSGRLPGDARLQKYENKITDGHFL